MITKPGQVELVDGDQNPLRALSSYTQTGRTDATDSARRDWRAENGEQRAERREWTESGEQ